MLHSVDKEDLSPLVRAIVHSDKRAVKKLVDGGTYVRLRDVQLAEYIAKLNPIQTTKDISNVLMSVMTKQVSKKMFG